MSRLADSLGILHLVLSDDAGAWQACRACCSAEDTVLLMDAGVMLLAAAAPVSGLPCRLAVAAVDAEARGLTEDASGTNPAFITDAGALDLITAHRHCLSWR